MARNRRFFPLTSDSTGFVYPTTLGNARKNVDVVFDMIGGNERLADWADKNPTEFFTKMYAKNIVKEVDTRIETVESLEDKLARLQAQADAGDRAINVTNYSVDGVPVSRERAPVREDDDE